MLTIKNALTYVWRKKIKTLIIFLILLAISTLTLASIAVKNATDVASKETFKSITNSFSMQVNWETNPGTPRGAGNVKEQDIEAISKLAGITHYVKRMNASADLIDHQLINMSDNSPQLSDEFQKKFGRAVMITGINDSSKEDKFTVGVFKLIKGRHITKNDQNVALIHKDFAQKNNLKVGDTIPLKSNTFDSDNVYKANKTVHVKVIGLIEGKNKLSATSPQELYENTFFTDIDTAKTLYGFTNKNAIYQDATFFVNGKQDINKIMEKAKALPIEWESFTLLKSTNNFPALQSSINGIYNVTNSLLIGTLIFGAILLTLVLFLWINGRRKEMGILLSVGISKTKIFFQFITEVLFISIFSFIGSYFTSSAISKAMGNSILKQVTSNISESIAQEGKRVNIGGGAEIDGFNKTLTSLNVHVSPDDMTKVVIFGLVIIIVSVLIASVTLLRKQPKELLMGDNSK